MTRSPTSKLGLSPCSNLQPCPRQTLSETDCVSPRRQARAVWASSPRVGREIANRLHLGVPIGAQVLKVWAVMANFEGADAAKDRYLQRLCAKNGLYLLLHR